MNIPETRATRVRMDKFGSLFVTFEIKREDYTPENRTLFESWWENGDSLDITLQSAQGSTPPIDQSLT